MGKSRSYEFMEYRSAIMNECCDMDNRNRLVRLITPDDIAMDDDYDPAEILPYKYLMPYKYIAGTQVEKERYLCFDISCEPSYGNTTYKNMIINFYIICHRDIIKYPDLDMKGYFRCWYDLVTCELDEMLCGDNPLDIGIGKFELQVNEPYKIDYEREIPMVGRHLVFSNFDWTSGKHYGK